MADELTKAVMSTLGLIGMGAVILIAILVALTVAWDAIRKVFQR